MRLNPNIQMATLVHELLLDSARSRPDQEALVYGQRSVNYRELAASVAAFSAQLRAVGVRSGDRIAVFAEKRCEVVAALLGANHASAVFVPVNPLLKGEQVAHILRDCNVRVLVTTSDRLATLTQALAECPDLSIVFVIDAVPDSAPSKQGHIDHLPWSVTKPPSVEPAPRIIDGDVAAILYTSGSTGKPKGVVLSHRNIVEGARSVAAYLELTSRDRLLCVLPLSFDYGLNQLTTALLTGATAILINHLFARDVVNAVVTHRITGLAAVPPLWIQLAELQWPTSVNEHLRYFTNSGGAMPRETLQRLRAALPKALPYLMYGLTEAFRSTFLPPAEVDRRPDSIGKAIPNAEILVLRPDGTRCEPGEAGELVHRGVHVALGYWNDKEKTAERFKIIPGQLDGLTIPEVAVWSGDTVKTDQEGFIYFIGRRDEMIKTSGYRVSPTELEETLYSSRLVGEVAAFGLPHKQLGHAIAIVATPADASVTSEAVLAVCQKQLPTYMVPRHIELVDGPLPRNPNGKIDRKRLATERMDLFEHE